MLSVLKFEQTVSNVGPLQVVSATGELFNHYDSGLPMWSDIGDRSVAVKVLFDSRFRAPPNVTIGLCGVDSASEQNLRFNLRALNVSKLGFDIEFLTWADTRIARVMVNWTAIGEPKHALLENLDKHLEKELS